MFVDTHAHLFWESYADDLDDVIGRAREEGVERIIVPGTDLITSRRAIELAEKYPGYIYAAVGIHPEETILKRNAVTESVTMFLSQVKKMRQLISLHRDSVVAVGEVGTDANTQELRDHMKEQKNLFREQCEIAGEFGLPVIVHTRKSTEETLSVLDSLASHPPGQFHCFSETAIELESVLLRGYSVSFCGNITWSKRVRSLVSLVPPDRLLLETDSPFMLPRDATGEPVMDNLRNEPSNVRILAHLIAELRGTSAQQIARQTTANVTRLFHI